MDTGAFSCVPVEGVTGWLLSQMLNGELSPHSDIRVPALLQVAFFVAFHSRFGRLRIFLEQLFLRETTQWASYANHE